MNGLSIAQDAYQMSVTVPETLVGMQTEGEGDGAAWHGVTCAEVDGRRAVVLVSISVTAFHPQKSARDALDARLQARHADGSACIEQFSVPGGNPAFSVRRVVTQRINGRDVTTGQAQALVAYPGAGALGVVSAVALDPADLDRAADLVTGIAAGMTVTGAPAAA
ncbi:MAG TPA: hypothetical protein VN714_00105 [Trebonia sp.]|jgi:hypothetical protein|nr:hypothetical protein [Trebonia sp.]